MAALAAALVVVFTSSASATFRPGSGPAAAPTDWASVIVRERSPGSPAAEALVRALGGTITGQLPIVRGFAARLPADEVARLAASHAVDRVWPDRQLRMRGVNGTQSEGDDDLPLDEYDGLAPNRVWQKALGLHRVWDDYEGKDVTVALLDTGVTETKDLDHTLRLRLDFTPGVDGIDRFGHGTHMAGVISGDGAWSDGRWAGVAPEAELISLKIAGPDGATDVSVVLAALQWVVSHKDDHDIGVLNLSFGTDSTQSYLVDPLDYAVERVWQAGIVVVVASGNDGPDPGAVGKPGDDPFVITVGAADLNGTIGRKDDAVAEFSSRGTTQDGVVKPDLLAPGISVVSIRAPGSTVDRLRPPARVNKYYVKGTGTSQATAVVSGIAALMLEANPQLTPDQVKAALIASVRGNLNGQPGAGAGLVDAERAVGNARDTRFLRDVPPQAYTPSTGHGSIDQSRGTHRSYTDFDWNDEPDPVAGEIDALGRTWDPAGWPYEPWSEESWSASPWNSLVAIGDEWDDAPPPAGTWPGLVWSSEAWSSKAWSNSSWVSKAWSSKAWSTWN